MMASPEVLAECRTVIAARLPREPGADDDVEHIDEAPIGVLLQAVRLGVLVLEPIETRRPSETILLCVIKETLRLRERSRRREEAAAFCGLPTEEEAAWGMALATHVIQISEHLKGNQ